MQDDWLSGVSGTAALASQPSRDAALLKAATDLFVLADAPHSADEIRRYEALAVHLVPRATPEDLAHLAERLADRADAPPALLRMLAKEPIAIAGPVLQRAQPLGEADLMAIIAATGPDHHRAIAARSGLPATVDAALRHLGIVPPLADPVAVTEPDLPPMPPRARRPDAWLFLGLDRANRLRVLAEVAASPAVRRPTRPPGGLERAFKSILSAAQVVGAARNRDRGAIIDILAEALALDPAFIASSLDDLTGEALAILLKALALEEVQAQQVFLLATSKVAFDTATFFRLCDLYAGLEPGVAEVMVQSWRGETPGAVRHQPVFVDSGERLRPSVPEPARERPATRPLRASEGRD